MLDGNSTKTFALKKNPRRNNNNRVAFVWPLTSHLTNHQVKHDRWKQYKTLQVKMLDGNSTKMLLKNPRKNTHNKLAFVWPQTSHLTNHQVKYDRWEQQKIL